MMINIIQWLNKINKLEWNLDILLALFSDIYISLLCDGYSVFETFRKLYMWFLYIFDNVFIFILFIPRHSGEMASVKGTPSFSRWWC